MAGKNSGMRSNELSITLKSVCNVRRPSARALATPASWQTVM